jgi:2-keto-4-pentenoate hydratase/2-oxohepta-3-ene-1,7-dioic acid hydratase in catechol pathway
MRLTRYNGGHIGVVRGDKIYDVTDAAGVDIRQWPPVGMVQLIADFDKRRAAIEAAAREGASSVSFADAHLETPVPWPNKLIAIPVNYHAHAIEMNSPAISRNAGFFVKGSSSLSGASDPIILPDLPGREVHHEAELAVIIGKRGRHIRREDALQYVFGYACLMDITVRGKQERAMRKSFDTFTPVGPWIVTADEVGDPSDLQVRLWVNEDLRQDANTASMIVDVPEIIALCSSAMTLEPGDVIATGTGEGVGPIKDRDIVTLEISRVGRMAVPVRQGEGGSSIAMPA